jgi:hypothetical protein
VVPALGQRRVIADITTKSRAQDVLSAMLGQQFVIDQVQEIPYPDSLFGVWGMRAAARNVDRKLGNGKKPPRPCP